MKKEILFFTLTLIAFWSFAPDKVRATTVAMPLAEQCSSCHKAEPGVMMGFLENISVKSQTMQMDLISHQEIIKFNDDTELKNIEPFADLSSYRRGEFIVKFIDRDGEKLATEIIRFDLPGLLAPAEQIAKDLLKKIITNPNIKTFDVRASAKFEKGHLPGAMPLPVLPTSTEFGKNLPADKETPIILYGDGGCLSHVAFQETRNLGYQDVRVYVGGYQDWSLSEYVLVEINWLTRAIADNTPHVLIDLRPAEETTLGHIRGAVAISLGDLTRNRRQFPQKKDLPIIFYGPASKEAAAKLISWGYQTVGIVPVSFDGWLALSAEVNMAPIPTTISY